MSANTRYSKRGVLSALAAAIAFSLAGGAAAETIASPGVLSAPGSITYDAEGVPIIRGANENDTAFLQGYAHARDRFFQMDFNRRGASGQVAELVGSAGLANDVQLRALGLRRAAFATWQAMSTETKGWLTSYAEGVNFWLSKNPLPPEYSALELTQVPPWSPVDTIVIGKALAFQLSFDLDIDYTLKLGAYQQAGTAAGFNGTLLFFEDTHRVQPPDNRVTITGFTPTAEEGEGSAKVALAPEDAAIAGMPMISDETLELARELRAKVENVPMLGKSLVPRENRAGSNEWIISGSRTASGRPILSNDPHLALDLAPIFQEVHIISASGPNVAGVSVPGTPGVIQGCNERICWGTTTNPLDVTDTFQERFVLNTYGLPTATVYKDVQWDPLESTCRHASLSIL